MIYRKLHLIFLVCILIPLYSLSQSYSYEYSFYDETFSCSQAISNYGDDFDLVINYSNGRPTGYTLTVISQADDPGDNVFCDEVDVFNTNLTINQALCDTFVEGASACCTDWDFDFIIKPNLSVLTPNPGADNQRETVNLEVTPGFTPEVYRWQYFSPVTSQWTLLPAQFQGQSTINVTAEDLFGANASSYYGVSIQFRLALCNGWSPNAFPYTYAFIRSAPSITNVIAVSESCPEQDDGGFTLYFDRVLSTGESLRDVTLLRTDGTTEQQVTTVNYTGTQYTWPNDVPAGTYKVRYQSLLGGVLSSIKESNYFTISQPTPITFSAAFQDVQCYEDNTGQISITAAGGSNSYLYSLDNGINYTPFTGGSNQTINGLSAGTPYLVKVKDTNQCVAQD